MKPISHRSRCMPWAWHHEVNQWEPQRHRRHNPRRRGRESDVCSCSEHLSSAQQRGKRKPEGGASVQHQLWEAPHGHFDKFFSLKSKYSIKAFLNKPCMRSIIKNVFKIPS